ncbi:hypothetical protein KP79_PYT04937 [Mizuhopecten yessoensis]|uniref:SH2 domain-containing protein n=1 Tax=Mizuhopecten yessoensis TaxID=6573 RepID=A0A210PWB5_MIZYE|nr:hypothetical protein KP79_PYT04937 [Mizuhopecten yessoensis]
MLDLKFSLLPGNLLVPSALLDNTSLLAIKLCILPSGVGNGFCPQAGPYQGRVGNGYWTQAGPYKGREGNWLWPQAGPYHGRVGNGYCPQAGPYQGREGNRFCPQAGPYHGRVGNGYCTQAGPNQDDHLRRKSLSTSEEEMYIGIPGNRTPVEHSGTEQPSLIVDDHIDPYRETQNFLIQSRPNSTRSQHTQSSPQTEQRDAEPVKPHGPEGNPTQMTIHPRHSPDGSLEKFDVQLVRQGSNQRWTCELKPSQTSKSHSRSPSIDTLDTDVTYDSHRQARDRNRPTVPLTLESAGTLQPTERWPNTDPSYKTTFNEDRRLPYCGDDNTLVKEISSPVGEELCRHIGQRVTYVENPVYMADQPFRSTNNLTSSVNTQNMLGYSGEMEPSRPGVHMNTVVGRSMSQSAPDIRQVTPFPPQTTRRPTVFPNKLKTRGHACVVHGYFNIHDEKAIEDAKKRLETDGEDGNWLVTLAIRQPMHSICLHVRLQNKTNSFPINNLKGERISIDTTNKKSFKCLCKLINYYTVKKTLPNQKVKLAKAFQLQQRGSGVYDSCTEVSHL